MLTERNAAIEGDRLRPVLKAVQAAPRIGCPAKGIGNASLTRFGEAAGAGIEIRRSPSPHAGEVA